MQQRIINRVEGDAHYRSYLDQLPMTERDGATDAITTAARQIAQTTKAKAIVCFTLQGSTVLRASQERPTVPILGITPFKETARQLVMSWGVYPDLPRSGSFGFTADELASAFRFPPAGLASTFRLPPSGRQALAMFKAWSALASCWVS